MQYPQPLRAEGRAARGCCTHRSRRRKLGLTGSH